MADGRWANWLRHRTAGIAGAGLVLTAGMTAALANFVTWYVAAGLGAASGAAGLYGGVWWQRRTDRRAREDAWRAVTTAAPGSHPAPADDDTGLLTMLLPGRQVVPFSPLHDRSARRVVQWALADSPARASVLYVDGAPGAGKSRLLVEVAERLALPCAWAVPGRGAAAVAAAAALRQRVVLVVDDADTCDDLPTTLGAWAEAADSDVRLVLISRVNHPWWAAVRARQPARVVAQLPYRPQVTVPAIVGDARSQQQAFARALRCFVAESAPVPSVTLKPSDPPPSIALLHAAAALAARTDVGGTVDTATVVAGIFAAERQRWQESARQAHLHNLPGIVLEQALLLAALVGAADEGAARRLLGQIRTPVGLIGPDRAGQLADWLRGLYPQQVPDWLAPRLPAVLLERYAVSTVAHSPLLAEALANATGRDDARTERALGTLARAAVHSPDAAAAISAVLDRDPAWMTAAAIRVAAVGELPVDEAIAACLDRHADRFTPSQLRQLDGAIPPEARTGRLARASVALLRRYVSHPEVDPDDPDTLAVRHYLASILTEQGQFGAAESEFREVLAARTRLLGEEHPDTLHTRNRFAVVLDLRAERGETEAQFRAVLAARTRLLGAEHPDTLHTRLSLGVVLGGQGRYDAAEAEFREVLAAQTRLLGEEHEDTLTTINNIAALLREQGRLGEAEDVFRALLAVRTRLFGAEHPTTLTVRGNLAVVLDKLGRAEAAEAEFRELLAARTRLSGAAHPDTVNIRNSLAILLGSRGKHREAEAQLREVLAVHTRSLGAEHPGTLVARSNLAIMVDAQARHEEAAAEFRAVLAIRTRTLGAEHPHTLSTRNSIAATLREQRRLGEAEAELRDLLATRTRLLGTHHPDALNTRGNLATVLSDQGRHAEATAEFEQVLAGWTQVLGPEHPKTLAMLSYLRANSRPRRAAATEPDQVA
ncbi:tetratricopeptide repeat protein [Micromonospora sp. WMMD1082]|uniref:tetratricopeptide repeat protein n=1 Tax=Micromonospora sp. WMMD1082 TaxID=3016104 RepID=UPI002417ACA1|nr:tetratricopeptide repeat protein [Micromonospora sp. WMMD1082]MDG4798018.1 tetratricopeptide repeat protein [Micromonospora sp. WMMD1082]